MDLVVSRRREGFGDALRQVMFALQYAKAMGATLAIDWRHSPYHTNRAINMFDRLFEPPDLGLPLVCGEDIHALNMPEPIARASEMRRAGRSIYDLDAKTLIFDNVLCGDGPRGMGIRGTGEQHSAFFSSLHLRPRFDDLLRSFMATNFDPPPVGLHIREGNGEFRAPSSCCPGSYVHRVIPDLDWFIGHALDRVGDRPFYLSTDSRNVRDKVLALRPDALLYPGWLPPDGRGPHHLCAKLSPSPIDTAAQVVIDMMLLGRCGEVYKGKYGVYLGFAFTKGGPRVYNLALHKGDDDDEQPGSWRGTR